MLVTKHFENEKVGNPSLFTFLATESGKAWKRFKLESFDCKFLEIWE